MANRPVDDFDPRDPHEDNAHEPIDDAADFGAGARRGASNHTHVQSQDYGQDDETHDDADFVDDDMSDIVDEADPLADDEAYDHSDEGHAEDEDHGDEEPTDDEAAEPAPDAKSRFNAGSLVFYAIIAAVVAGGGFMIYRTFTGGDSGARTQTAATSNITVPTESTGPTPAPLPASNASPVTAATQPPIQVATQAQGQAPTPTTAGASWQTTLPPEPAAAAQVQTQPQMPAQVQAQAPITAQPATTNMVAPLAAAASSNTEALAGVNARLAELETKFGQLSQATQNRLGVLEQKPAQAAPAVSNGNAADITALRNQIADLQKQLAQVNRTQQSLQTQVGQQQSAPAAPASTPKASTPKTAKAAPSPQLSRSLDTVSEAAQPRTVATAPAASPKAQAGDTDATPRSPKAGGNATAGKSSWVLRAATPGMAWLSPNAGSAELKRVVPGDQLAGIGQVTAIRQDNGRWIVEGSQGTIR